MVLDSRACAHGDVNRSTTIGGANFDFVRADL
jgi:hypothetical protein